MSGIPNLSVTLISPYGQMLASIAPANARDGVIGWQLCQLLDLGGACAPDIDSAIEAHGQYVLATPVHQVEVEIILELRGIENLKWRLVDFARLLALSSLPLSV
jgi:hypothetical protein